MKYDYLKKIVEDVKDYIKENYEGVEEVDKEALYDDLWIEDSVTGNVSGSYTFNSEAAREFILNNEDLLQEALEEFCCSSDEIAKHIFDYEWQDVTIRCYLLSQAIDEAIEELEEEEQTKVFDVTIEETLSQTFKIEAKTLEEAVESVRLQYKNGEIYVENGEVYSSQIMGYDEENDEATSWIEV